MTEPAPTRADHPPPDDFQPPWRVDPARLPHPAQLALVTQALADAAARAVRTVAVFPAGEHSRRLGPEPFRRAGLRLAAYLDDARTGDLHGVPIVPPAHLTEPVDAVVISTDSAEQRCAARAAEFVATWTAPRRAKIIRPYAPLEETDPATLDALRRRHDLRRAALARLRAAAAQRTAPLRLNLGCGQHPLPGWTNIDGGDGLWWHAPQHADVLPLDVFEALDALPDASCSRVYSEHFYEHFTLDEGFRVARQWARVLAPGGVLRVVTPDLACECAVYLGLRRPAPPEVIERHKRRWLGDRHAPEVARFLTPAMLLNFGTRLDGHQFLYDEDTLRAQLLAAGFTDVVRRPFGHSEHDDLRAIEHHDGGATGGAWTHEVQLVVEARRP